MATKNVSETTVRSKIEQAAKNFNYRLEHNLADEAPLRKETTRKLVLQVRELVESKPELAATCAALLHNAPQKYPRIFDPLPLYFEAVQFYSMAEEMRSVAEIYSKHIARLYLDAGNLLFAFEAFRRSVGIYYALNMREEIAGINGTWALSTFDAVLEAARTLSDGKIDAVFIKDSLDYGMNRLLPEIAKSGRYEEALAYYAKVLGAVRSFGGSVNAARIRCRQARLLFKMGREDEARIKFIQAFDLFSRMATKANDTVIEGVVDGEVYFGMNEFIRARQVDLALMLLSQYNGPIENLVALTEKVLKNVVIYKFGIAHPFEVARYAFFVVEKFKRLNAYEQAANFLIEAAQRIPRIGVEQKIIAQEFLTKALEQTEAMGSGKEALVRRILVDHEKLSMQIRTISGDGPFNARKALRKETQGLPPVEAYRFKMMEVNAAIERYAGKLVPKLNVPVPTIQINVAREVMMLESGHVGARRMLEK